jgi:cyclin-dependent kinase
LKKIKIK